MSKNVVYNKAQRWAFFIGAKMEKTIEWKPGKYKYREAVFAYVNQIKVAVIIPMHDGTRFDGKVLLPGLPKGTNSFSSLDGAKGIISTNVQKWFQLVAQ